LAIALPQPDLRMFVLARLAGDRAGADAARAPFQVAHAVSKANGVGNNDLARRALIADHDTLRITVGSRAPRVEVVRAQVYPAVAHQTVIDANLCLPPGVVDFVELRSAIAPVPHPSVDRIETGRGNNRRVGSRGGFCGA